MQWLNKLRTSTLAVLTAMMVFIAFAVISPNLPHMTLHAQQVGPSGVPGSGGGSAVSSVFGRTGAVTAGTGDYACAQVTNCAAINVANTFSASQTIAATSARITLDDLTDSHPVYMYDYVGFQIFGSTLGGGDTEAIYQQSYHAMVDTLVFGWSSGTYLEGGVDTGLSRAASGVVAVGKSDTRGDSSGWLQSSAIGSGVAANTDLRGHLTAASSAFSYTFTNSYSVAPVCVLSDTTAQNVPSSSVTTTTLSGTTTGASDTVSYICAD